MGERREERRGRGGEEKSEKVRTKNRNNDERTDE
jgi:hypothetical protein